MKRKLQVFVSSTFSDLKNERQAAVAAILKAGHIPAGMELFTSGDKSQMEVIQRWIDESDVYMLILGGRYGSIEKSTGVSYTELEYDYASNLKKPLFALVIDEAALEAKVKEGGTDFIEKENPKELKAFREKVLSKMSAFFSDDKDIRLSVYESLSDFERDTNLKGWVSAGEIEDPAPLHDEIKRLRTVIEKLQAERSKPIQMPVASPAANNEIDELIQTLHDIKVKIPPSIVNGKPDVTKSLLDLFVSAGEHFVNGVTNSVASGDVETFLYHNIAPKLKIHGLVENEKVPGVQYRRSFATPKGVALLAELERRKIRIKKEQANQEKPAAAEQPKAQLKRPGNKAKAASKKDGV